jgi:hypothetical protein
MKAKKYYVIAEDMPETANLIARLLEERIEAEFGLGKSAVEGVVCLTVEEAIRGLGCTDLALVVLDLKFGRDVGAGFRILKARPEVCREDVVVWSFNLGFSDGQSDESLSDALVSTYQIPPEQIVDGRQGAVGLWAACRRVLSRTLRDPGPDRCAGDRQDA